MGIKQFPYTLKVLQKTEAQYDPDTGNWIPGTEEWISISKCRDEGNGGGNRIVTTDGEIYVFGAVIYLPKNSPSVELGAKIRVLDKEGNTRLEGDNKLFKKRTTTRATMGLTLDSSGFERQIAQATQAIEDKMVQILADAGRVIAAAARANGNYRDVSGDLRNSNGFLLMIDGIIKAEGFLSGNGATKARALALQVSDTSRGVISLVVVNGMDYAAKVESRGLDVLTSAEQFAKRAIPQMINQLKQ